MPACHWLVDWDIQQDRKVWKGKSSGKMINFTVNLIYQSSFQQLLERVQLRAKHEGSLWSYLSTTVSQTVTDSGGINPSRHLSQHLLLVPHYNQKSPGWTTDQIRGRTYTNTGNISKNDILHIDSSLYEDTQEGYGHSSPKSCVSFYIRDVCKALSTKGIQLQPAMALVWQYHQRMSEKPALFPNAIFFRTLINV